jgi:uracil-DNA glycosylase family protein
MATRTRIDRPGAQEWVPQHADVPELRSAATACHGCELWEPATQVVFSSGDPQAPVVLVGEQPGDVEDQSGEPFVGPAGKLLRKALEEAGVDPDNAYYTNAVKHFRFQTRGKRRIHEKPDLVHVNACRPWLAAELLVVKPRVVVVLGATAAAALMGRDFRVTKQRGQVIEGTDHTFVATVHPSSILRAPADTRDQAHQDFVDDLKVVAAQLR